MVCTPELGGCDCFAVWLRRPFMGDPVSNFISTLTHTLTAILLTLLTSNVSLLEHVWGGWPRGVPEVARGYTAGPPQSHRTRRTCMRHYPIAVQAH